MTKDILLVTGLSGAGKSTVLKTLEDLGWEVVDNLPLVLLDRLLEAPLAAGYADDGHLRRGSIRPSGRRTTGRPAAECDRRRRVELARGGLDPEHTTTHGERG